MKLQSPSPSSMILLCLFFSISFSCSNDTDLLAEAILPGGIDIGRVAIDDRFFLAKSNGSVILNIIGNDNIQEQEDAIIEDTSTPTLGSVAINEDNTITYTPNPEVEEGEDSFTYTITTSSGNSGTGTVRISLSEKNNDLGELKAFPGAEGFGKNATGGRGGRVIEVTNLNDSGPGSLRAAVETTGRRTVVFKVSGYIELKTRISVRSGDITIAGQTSPNGITLRGSVSSDLQPLMIITNNVIVRGLRIRLGRGRNKGINGDAVTLSSGNNIIFDHCSFSWATDEIINPYGASKITFQNCIFSEALMYSSHAYSTDTNSSGYYKPHSMGMLIGNGSNEITIFNNVFAHNNQRNPLIGGDNDAGEKFEIVNNIIYNWGDFGTSISKESQTKVNLINNWYINGPNSNKNRYPILIGNTTKAYVKNNINVKRPNSSSDEWLAIGGRNVPFTEKASSVLQSLTPFDYPLKDYPTKEVTILLDELANNVGAFVRDAVDDRIINDVYNKTGSLINDPSEVGGYPAIQQITRSANYDKDGDGMEDAWELVNGLDPTNPNDGKTVRPGMVYTNLEIFLHMLTL